MGEGDLPLLYNTNNKPIHIMGLDQYAGVREKGDEKILEIAVWRKHPNLQGWMEKRYRLKGGTEEFNCVNLELTSKDIDDLEVAVSGEADSALPKTTGFFFGSDSDDHYKEQDLKFISDAREALEQGKEVIYSSWW